MGQRHWTPSTYKPDQSAEDEQKKQAELIEKIEREAAKRAAQDAEKTELAINTLFKMQNERLVNETTLLSLNPKKTIKFAEHLIRTEVENRLKSGYTIVELIDLEQFYSREVIIALTKLQTSNSSSRISPQFDSLSSTEQTQDRLSIFNKSNNKEKWALINGHPHFNIALNQGVNVGFDEILYTTDDINSYFEKEGWMDPIKHELVNEPVLVDGLTIDPTKKANIEKFLTGFYKQLTKLEQNSTNQFKKT